jgi:serine/threonine protein kinase
MQGSEGLAPGSIPVQSGDVLAGKYRVDRVLGVGGMGVVVAATHLQLDQKVALKFMLPEALRLPALVERFAREARAAVRLRSEHVARVLDVGTLETGSPYMVMEYLEGNDLGSLVETRGPLPIETAVDCVLQACDAVAEAHSLGIVHRDLKPRNLFLTHRNDGRALIKVLDFGIAKQTGMGADLSLTGTAEVIGSPNYMSPEQLKSSKAVDERSDIWALGVILYELLSGALPFAAESVTHLIAMVLSESPRPIREIRADVPDELGRVIRRCLEKEPAARFASVAALAAALERFAPADSRGLASRIARISSGSRPFPSELAATAAPPGASSGTTANWSAKTSLAGPSRGRLVAIVGIAVTAGLASIAGLIAALWPSHDVPALQGPASQVAPSMIAAAHAPETPSATIAVVPLPVLVGTTAVSASAPVSSKNDAGPERLERREPVPRPRHEAVAPTSSVAPNEPPKYRTSW